MSVPPAILGICAAFCWGTADFISKGASQRMGYYRTLLYMNAVSVVGLLLLSPTLTLETAVTPYLLAVMVVLSVTNFAGGLLLYQSFQEGLVSIVAPIVYSYPVITVLLAILFLGQTLTLAEAVALAALIVGAIFFSTRLSELRQSFRSARFSATTPKLGAAFLAALLLGLTFYGFGVVIPATGYLLPALFVKVTVMLLGVGLGPALKQTVRPIRNGAAIVLAMGALETIGVLAFNIAIFTARDSLSIVTALSGTGGAFAVTYALVLLRERLEPNQLLGVVLALIGAASIIYLTT